MDRHRDSIQKEVTQRQIGRYKYRQIGTEMRQTDRQPQRWYMEKSDTKIDRKRDEQTDRQAQR